MESGKWKVGSGKWEVESGKWKVKNRKWEVESEWLKVRSGGQSCSVMTANRSASDGDDLAAAVAMSSPPALVNRTYRFSLAALRFYRRLAKTPDAQVPGLQFYKAATSAWSNYRASQRGRSRAEFVAKLGTAVEESDEAVGWLEFMRDGDIASDDGLLSEAKQICAMLTASLTNARNNRS